MNPLLKIELQDEDVKLVASDYIGRNEQLGVTHVRSGEWYKTALGEFITHENHPNCMLLIGEDIITLWTTRSVFIGDTISINELLYNI